MAPLSKYYEWNNNRVHSVTVNGNLPELLNDSRHGGDTQGTDTWLADGKSEQEMLLTFHKIRGSLILQRSLLQQLHWKWNNAFETAVNRQGVYSEWLISVLRLSVGNYIPQYSPASLSAALLERRNVQIYLVRSLLSTGTAASNFSSRGTMAPRSRVWTWSRGAQGGSITPDSSRGCTSACRLQL